MAKYIVKRVAMGIFSVFIVATLTFFIIDVYKRQGVDIEVAAVLSLGQAGDLIGGNILDELCLTAVVSLSLIHI